MKKGLLLTMLFVLNSTLLWADDDFPPPWRMEEKGTLYAEFSEWPVFQVGGFVTPADRWASNPAMLNLPEAERISAEFLNLFPRTNVVKVNEPDGLIIKLDNFGEPNPEKLIRIQVTYLAEEPQYLQPNSVFGFNTWLGWGMQGPHQFFPAGAHLINRSPIKPGGWVTEAYEFPLVPNPEMETIGLKFNRYPAFVDQVVVDTWCKRGPEPKMFEFGDAPEGGVAYPASGVIGMFPTCMTVGPAQWIQHSNFGASFGPSFDFEPDGNAGACPGCFPPYDQDECFQDGDAGLLIPGSFTIDHAMNVVPCLGSAPMPLGQTCQSAAWGANIDVEIHNHMPNQSIGYVNVLIDWDQNGAWGGASNCSGIMAPEHVLVDWIVPNPYDGPLSALMPPGFVIGPNPGYVWTRISITETPVGLNWDGSGIFEDGETEDYLLLVDPFQQPDELDFGDAPDPTYPTQSASNGANHVIRGPWLGDATDAPDPEPDGQQSPNADGDDLDGNDDENGIHIPLLTEGYGGFLTVTVSDPGGIGGFVEIWIDWNKDGTWAHPGEQVFGGFMLVGNNPVLVTPPANSAGQTFLRARISSQGWLSPVGPAPDGEVEDHEVRIQKAEYDIKWEQLPDPRLSGLHAHDYGDPYTQIIVADDWLCEGGVVTDFHWWGTVENESAGLKGFHLSIHPNDPASCLPGDPAIWQMDIPITNITITPEGGMYRYDYYLEPQDYFYQEQGQRYWFDVSALSADPTKPCKWIWAEHKRSSTPVLCGAADKIIPSQPYWKTIYWSQQVYSDMAFRVTNSTSVDMVDFGDAPDSAGIIGYQTLLINNGARHVIGGPWLGNIAPDPEGNGQPVPAGIGDDLNGWAPDDEDGVMIPALYQGMPAVITVQVSGGGVVEGWIDFNANNVWDGSEQVHNAFLPSGTHAINVSVPISAFVGQTYARFRISFGGVGVPFGPAPDGEVEDYVVRIEQGPRADLGDAPDSTNSSGSVMTAYIGVQANYPTVFSGLAPVVPIGPKHMAAFSDAWLGQSVSLEDEADVGLDADMVNNIDPVNDANDLDGADDGLVLPVQMPGCKWTNVDYVVNVPPTAGTGIYYVNIWCDWNRDGDWSDLASCTAGPVPEWAVRNQMLVGLAPGQNTVTSLPFVSWHPADGPKQLWMRITLSEQIWQESWGAGGCGPMTGYAIGETEDYLVEPDTSCVECADLDCDGVVNLSDFAIFASQWLTTCP